MSAEKHDATSSEDEAEVELAPIKSPISPPAPKTLRSPRTSLLPVVNSTERKQTPGPANGAPGIQSSTPNARTRALSSFSQSSDENSGLVAPPSTGRKRISMSFTLPVAPSPDVQGHVGHAGAGSSPPTRPTQHLDTYAGGVNHSPTPSGSGLRTLSASRTTTTTTATKTSTTTSTKSPPPPQVEDRAGTERGRPRNAGSGTGSEVMEYLSQLATKESRVSKLREKLLEVKRELESAEADLKQFKTKDVLMLHMPHLEGQQQQQQASSAQETSLLDSIQTKLMSLAVEEEEEREDRKTRDEMVPHKQLSRENSTGTLRASKSINNNFNNNNHDEVESLKRDKRVSHPVSHAVSHSDQRPTLSHSSSSSVSSTQSSGTHIPLERRRASISAPGLPPRDDVMSMGKRVIGEIGSQFYGLVADIRSATFGDDLTYQNPSLNYGGNTNNNNGHHHSGGGQMMHARRVSGAQLRGEASSSPSSRRRSGRDVVDSYSYI